MEGGWGEVGGHCGRALLAIGGWNGEAEVQRASEGWGIEWMGRTYRCRRELGEGEVRGRYEMKTTVIRGTMLTLGWQYNDKGFQQMFSRSHQWDCLTFIH